MKRHIARVALNPASQGNDGLCVLASHEVCMPKPRQVESREIRIAPHRLAHQLNGALGVPREPQIVREAGKRRGVCGAEIESTPRLPFGDLVFAEKLVRQGQQHMRPRRARVQGRCPLRIGNGLTEVRALVLAPDAPGLVVKITEFDLGAGIVTVMFERLQKHRPRFDEIIPIETGTQFQAAQQELVGLHVRPRFTADGKRVVTQRQFDRERRDDLADDFVLQFEDIVKRVGRNALPRHACRSRRRSIAR